MTTMLLLYELKPEQEKQIQDVVPEWTIVSGRNGPLTEEHYRNAEIVLGWNADMEKALDSGSKLKWVQTSSAGVERLPLVKLKQHGVHLTSASGIHPVSMAETLFAMLLAFSRNLHHAVQNQSRREWKASDRYYQLSGKTMGIIGAGVIGGEIARLAGAFGMRTLGIRRSSAPLEGIDRMYAMEQLDEVLSLSDVVVNVLPFTDETRYLFNAERFAQMRKDAWFFNMGRGASVDTDALVQALRVGTVGAAGLDVFEVEPLPADHPLWTMDNVIITPHIGGWTDHYKKRVADILLHNLHAYTATGKPSRNLVDYDRMY
ncbi:D-2-hydroxyacid dehydrogenase [Cohnella lupini]|uniref:Phosphoglycerate dehydrogenase-like enzyme n=1 Tax=Cohnella lupini TaxID=1294267 RepID=A0A3D9I393_9BACL|nr:D-2-hydroxyacid dehydrogenase [Cohnella lupini]RED56243.1 phosphoglycerate dehydrogenase-like enzyme [Cohnella lupini]